MIGCPRAGAAVRGWTAPGYPGRSRAAGSGGGGERGGVRLEGREVVERIRATPLAGVDETHEEVGHLGPPFRLEEEGVLPVEDGLLERTVADVVVQGRAREVQEAGERFPVLPEVGDRLTEAGVRLHAPLGHLRRRSAEGCTTIDTSQMHSRRLLTLSPTHEPLWVRLYVEEIGERCAAMLLPNEEPPPEPGRLKGLAFFGDTAEEAEQVARGYLECSEPVDSDRREPGRSPGPLGPSSWRSDRRGAGCRSREAASLRLIPRSFLA